MRMIRGKKKKNNHRLRKPGTEEDHLQRSWQSLSLCSLFSFANVWAFMGKPKRSFPLCRKNFSHLFNPFKKYKYHRGRWEPNEISEYETLTGMVKLPEYLYAASKLVSLTVVF